MMSEEILEIEIFTSSLLTTSCICRITEGLRWEGTSGDRQAQSPAQSGVRKAGGRTGPWPVAFWIISKDTDSTTPLGILFHCLTSLMGKKFVLLFIWNFFCFILCPLPLIPSLDTSEKRLSLSSLLPSVRYLYTRIRSPLSLLFLRAIY